MLDVRCFKCGGSGKNPADPDDRDCERCDGVGIERCDPRRIEWEETFERAKGERRSLMRIHPLANAEGFED